MKKLFILIFIATIFLNDSAAQVSQEWVRQYFPGTGSGINYAYAIAIDKQGNSYVTGESAGDYATIKYSPSGNQLWAQRYNGPGNQIDRANAIAVDDSGNVFVTGYSSGGDSTKYDFATIKYNSEGDTIWVSRFNGPGNSNDFAYSMGLDKSGNIYVSGTSVDSNSIKDFATLKYSPSGILEWVQIFDNPENFNFDYNLTYISVEPSGNSYVSGTSEANFLTIKYNTFGDSIWAVVYGKKVNRQEQTRDNKIDDSGNVYVAGFSYNPNGVSGSVIVKYDSSGSKVWEELYNSYINSIAVDDSENVYAVYQSGDQDNLNITTIKFDRNGDSLWVTEYDNSFFEIPTSLAVDDSGNVFVVGRIFILYDDFLTLKYNSSGTLQWEEFYDSPFRQFDVPFAIAVDNSGNVYVTGGSYDAYVTIKYSQFTNISQISNSPPYEYKLYQNYPNPFNPVTTINFSIPKQGKVILKVYDVTGKEVKTLINEQRSAGNYKVSFSSTDGGSNLSSGAYFYSIESGDFKEVKRMIFLK